VYNCLFIILCFAFIRKTIIEVGEDGIMEVHGFMYNWGWWVVKAGAVVMAVMAISAGILAAWVKRR
jgi:hypothetical protein